MDTSGITSLGVLSLINYANKHADKLAAHPNQQIAQRAGDVRGSCTDLEDAYAAARPLRALWSRAVAVKDVADDDLDDYISQTSYELLGPTMLRGDRDAADYRVLFPTGNIQFIHGPDGAEIVQVLAIATYLELTPSHPMAGRAATLRQKAEVMKAAMGPAAAAEAAHLSALGVQRDSRKALIRTLRKNVRFLRDQLDGDEKKVEALFPTLAESKTKEEEGEAPLTP